MRSATYARMRRGLVVVLAAFAMADGAASGQDRIEPKPDALEEVGVTEHPGDALPLDATFLDSEGKRVRLGDYFGKDRPVLLTLNYYACPMLCTLQLNGMVEALKGLPWSPGEEFEIVTVSFDPTEVPALAAQKKESYVQDYGKAAARHGWHFLTGDKESIERLTEAVGFRYAWNADSRQWAHAATLVVCTPDGRISRYLYDVTFEPKTLRLAMVEASDGKVGTPFDQFLLFCFHYDAEAGRYAPVARRIMSVGGALTVLLLGGTLSLLWVRDTRRRNRLSQETGPPSES